MKHLGTIIVTALLLVACKEPIEPETVIRPAQVWVVKAQNIDESVVYSGKVHPQHETPLSFRVAGKVIERLVDLGDSVTKGQAIARLDNTDSELNVSQAAANLNATQSELNSSRSHLATMQSNVTASQSTLATAQSNLVSAQSNLSSARSNVAAVRSNADAAQASIRVAQSELENAQQEYQRTQQLFQQKFISKTVLDRDANRLRTAQANVRSAQAQWKATQAQVKAAQGEVGAAQGNVAALQSQVQSAQAQVKAAKEQVKIAMAQVESTQARMKAVGAQNKLAENQSRYTILKSPYAGIVTQTLIDNGQVVAAGQAIITLAQQNSFEVHINVGEQQVKQIQLNTAVKLSLWTDKEVSYQGTVKEIAPAADANRSWLVKVAINDDVPALKLGMTANVYFQQAAQQEVTWLPASALYQSKNQAAIWELNNENQVKLEPIELVKHLDDGVLIKGLEIGKTIIAAGVHRLSEGQEILPVPYTGRAAFGRD